MQGQEYSSRKGAQPAGKHQIHIQGLLDGQDSDLQNYLCGNSLKDQPVVVLPVVIFPESWKVCGQVRPKMKISCKKRLIYCTLNHCNNDFVEV